MDGEHRTEEGGVVEAFGAEANGATVTEAVQMSHRNTIETRILTPLPRDVVALLGPIEDATGGEALVGPLWSEMAFK